MINLTIIIMNRIGSQLCRRLSVVPRFASVRWMCSEPSRSDLQDKMKQLENDNKRLMQRVDKLSNDIKLIDSRLLFVSFLLLIISVTLHFKKSIK